MCGSGNERWCIVWAEEGSHVWRRLGTRTSPRAGDRICPSTCNIATNKGDYNMFINITYFVECGRNLPGFGRGMRRFVLGKGYDIICACM